jgi:hypothetical protein
VLDTRFAGRTNENRWNRQGQPTFYVAGDHGVLIAEFARHLKEQRTPAMGKGMIARRIYDFELSLPHTLDVRDPRVIAALSLANAPACFLDREVARATADFLRQTTPAEALLLPSIAFLDQPERWVMAIFLEKLPDGIDGVVSSVTKDGLFRHED